MYVCIFILPETPLCGCVEEDGEVGGAGGSVPKEGWRFFFEEGTGGSETEREEVVFLGLKRHFE